ncbi:divalent-cation tolerance protein CutA [Halorubrum vacuolatum]|uniref:Divalent cation tolerance protein n=1 Tax=Halorubrum vacuolatum TaxID=63740 RepID=A0A238WXI3_HALVU|nr:divalent-cation tolerance protein CutA [Halorubrum vacuolatum]SNR51061.1 divalent cation tolerance protein [Halorubrum vacuolatum]
MTTVYVTAPEGDADELAETLVERRLAACVNVVDCESTYRWDGAVHSESERILLIKTTADAYPALREAIEELHPHDVPCIERFKESDVPEAFADWVASNVSAVDS